MFFGKRALACTLRGLQQTWGAISTLREINKTGDQIFFEIRLINIYHLNKQPTWKRRLCKKLSSLLRLGCCQALQNCKSTQRIGSITKRRGPGQNKVRTGSR